MCRRSFLIPGVGVLSASLGGCVSQVRNAMSTGNDEPNLDAEFRIAEGPRQSVEASIEREYEYDDESDTVIVATTGAEFSWEDWAHRRAQRAAADHIADFLGDAWINQGIYPSIPRDLEEYLEGYFELDFGEFPNSDGDGLIVEHVTVLSREGTVIKEPEVEFETVVERVPSALDMTFELHEGSVSVEFPVVCVRAAEQFDEG